MEKFISRDLFYAFLIYLVSHHRPISELLAPHEKDITEVYEQHFAGITREPVTVEALIAARHALADELKQQFTDPDKEFLLSIKRGDPDWDSFPLLQQARELPAVQWKFGTSKTCKQPGMRRAWPDWPMCWHDSDCPDDIPPTRLLMVGRSLRLA